MTSDFNLDKLQEENKVWTEYNFGKNRSGDHPLIGMIEELGELRLAGSLDEKEDAIGDVMIYMADYANSMSIKLSELYTAQRSDISLEYLFFRITTLCHNHLKYTQGIRNPEYQYGQIKTRLNELLNYLYDVSNRKLLEITERVWNKVKQRDWRKNPNGNPNDASTTNT